MNVFEQVMNDIACDNMVFSETHSNSSEKTMKSQCDMLIKNLIANRIES